VETVLGELNLSPYGDNLVTTLSGGEGRRCLVARALVQDTPVVLLDEPTAGLDIRQALFLLAAIRRRVQAGGLVVSVLHDLNLAASHADVLVFLQAGRVVAAGGVEEVFRPDILRQVYDTPAAVGRDAFTASLTASFRL
jgi:iron complex transport system ATP-binding protein